MQLPIRVDIATGERLPPSGIDPYTLPWVQGAASTVHRKTRMKYAPQVADLREKLVVLRSRGRTDYDISLYGPRLRSRYFRSLDGRPGGEWPEYPWGGESRQER